MTKIEELTKLLHQMQNITATDEYMEEVGFQTPRDNSIINAINDLRDALDINIMSREEINTYLKEAESHLTEYPNIWVYVKRNVNGDVVDMMYDHYSRNDAAFTNGYSIEYHFE